MARRSLSTEIHIEKTGNADAAREVASDIRDLADAGSEVSRDLDRAGKQSDDFARAVGRAEREVENLDGALSEAKGAMDGFSAGSVGVAAVGAAFIGVQSAIEAAAVAFRGLEALIGGSIAATAKQEEALRQLESALESAGGASGLTSAQLQKMAKEFQALTTFGDELVLEMQSVLVTFTSIGEDVFPRASAAILDMAARMGTDLQTAAVQVGKALNDPVQGVSALSEVGIQFTGVQRQMIDQMVETGDVAGAQAVILEELETRFQGAAEAARDTLGGSLEAASNAVGSLAEAMGEGGLGRAVKGMADDLTQAAESGGQLEAMAEKLGAAFGLAFEGISIVVKQLVEDLATLAAGTSTVLNGLVQTLNDVAQRVADFASLIPGVGGAAAELGRGWEELATRFNEFSEQFTQSAAEVANAADQSLKRDAVEALAALGLSAAEAAVAVDEHLRRAAKSTTDAGAEVAAGAGEAATALDGVGEAARKAGEEAVKGVQGLQSLDLSPLVTNLNGVKNSLDGISATAVRVVRTLGAMNDPYAAWDPGDTGWSPADVTSQDPTPIKYGDF